MMVKNINLKKLSFSVLIIVSIALGGFIEHKAFTKGRIEKVLSTSTEPSRLQCLQRCMFVNKQAVASYAKGVCTCALMQEDDANTLTNIFMHKKDQSTKPTTKPTTTPEPLINVALRKPVSENSEVSWNDPSLANDGSLGPKRSLTQQVENAWWRVNLMKTFHIEYILLYSKLGKDFNRDIYIETSIEDMKFVTCFRIKEITSKFLKIICDKPASARYVKITAKEYCYLSFYEVEVYAKPPA